MILIIIKLKNFNYYRLFLIEFFIRNIILRKKIIYQKLIENSGVINIQLTTEERKYYFLL